MAEQILPALYTYEEAAEKLKISEVTLRRFVSQKKIRCLKIGRSVRFTDKILMDALKPAGALN